MLRVGCEKRSERKQRKQEKDSDHVTLFGIEAPAGVSDDCSPNTIAPAKELCMFSTVYQVQEAQEEELEGERYQEKREKREFMKEKRRVVKRDS